MTKHRKTRRSQKGGIFGFFETPPNPYAPKKQSIWDSMPWSTPSYPTQIQSSYQSPTQNQSIWDSMPWSTPSYPTQNQPAAYQSSYQSPSQFQPAYQAPMLNPSQTSFIGPIQRQNSFQSPAQSSSYGSGYGSGYGRGGKLRKQTMNKNKTMKGGKGGLGLTYYATPVSGLAVAEPTSWQYYANGTNQYTVKGGSKTRHSCKSRKSCKICKTRKQRK